MRTKNKDKELNHRHFIGLRLTDVELDLLDQGAACLSVSRSEYLRKLLLEKQINHQIEVVADMNDLRKLVSEYGKIGSNLNQIAKRITERVLGTRYGKEYLEQTFLRKDPLTILYVRSHLRLVVNLQTNVKAMQSPAYAHRVKLSNLQQMANTIIYVQEHGFDTQSDLKNTLLASKQELKEMQTQVAQHRSDLRILNNQIRYTGQYYANKEVYSQFSKAKYKGKYRKEHEKEIQKYEEARDWLRSFYQDGKMTSLKTLTLQKEKLQQQIIQTFQHTVIFLCNTGRLEDGIIQCLFCLCSI